MYVLFLVTLWVRTAFAQGKRLPRRSSGTVRTGGSDTQEAGGVAGHSAQSGDGWNPGLPGKLR